MNEMEDIDSEQPEPVEEYVPGIAGGKNYMARLCRFENSPWFIDAIHIEGLPPLGNPDKTWPTRDEAAAAAEAMVAALSH